MTNGRIGKNSRPEAVWVAHEKRAGRSTTGPKIEADASRNYRKFSGLFGFRGNAPATP